MVTHMMQEIFRRKKGSGTGIEFLVLVFAGILALLWNWGAVNVFFNSMTMMLANPMLTIVVLVLLAALVIFLLYVLSAKSEITAY